LKSEKYRQNNLDMQENSIDIADFAKKQRFTALVQKMKDGKALNPAEIKWLERYQMAKKKQKEAVAKQVDVKKKRKPDVVVKPEVKEPARALDPKRELRERFCQEYIKDLNATQAAIRAGYSEKTACEQGSRLLANVKVQERISELKQAQQKRIEINADEILTECYRIATSDVAGAFDENGCLKPIHEIPIDIRRAISSIETLEEFVGTGEDRVSIGHTRKIKLWSKDKNIETLLEHLGLLTKKINISGNLNNPFENMTPAERVAAMRAAFAAGKKNK